MEIKIRVDASAIDALASRLAGGRGLLLQAACTGIANRLKDHFADRQVEPRKDGFTPRNFWSHSTLQDTHARCPESGQEVSPERKSPVAA